MLENSQYLLSNLFSASLSLPVCAGLSRLERKTKTTGQWLLRRILVARLANTAPGCCPVLSDARTNRHASFFFGSADRMRCKPAIRSVAGDQPRLGPHQSFFFFPWPGVSLTRASGRGATVTVGQTATATLLANPGCGKRKKKKPDRSVCKVITRKQCGWVFCFESPVIRGLGEQTGQASHGAS